MPGASNPPAGNLPRDETKVTQLEGDIIGIVEQEILQFQVAMSPTPRMHVTDCVEDLLHEVTNESGREPTMRLCQ